MKGKGHSRKRDMKGELKEEPQEKREGLAVKREKLAS